MKHNIENTVSFLLNVNYLAANESFPPLVTRLEYLQILRNGPLADASCCLSWKEMKNSENRMAGFSNPGFHHQLCACLGINRDLKFLFFRF